MKTYSQIESVVAGAIATLVAYPNTNLYARISLVLDMLNGDKKIEKTISIN